jgi:hypothetical protein
MNDSLVVMRPANHDTLLSEEKCYKYVIELAGPSSFVRCYVMYNGVCVLKLNCNIPNVLDHIKNFRYLIDFRADSIKGKRKKSAIKLKIGSPLCSCTTNNDEIITFRTPVGGQLLEINDNYVKDPEKIKDGTCLNNYIAIIIPNITFPDFDEIDEKSNIYLNELLKPRYLSNRRCFDWLKTNSCQRGDSCKFIHDR